MRCDNSAAFKKLGKRPLNILSEYEPGPLKEREQGGALSNVECKWKTN